MSHIVQRSAYLRVPVAAINLPQLQKSLTIVDKSLVAQMEAGLHDHALEPPNPYLQEFRYQDGDDIIYVPRRCKLPKELATEDNLPAWDKKYKFVSKVTPRPHQYASIAAAHRAGKIVEGVLDLSTGHGKTAVLLHVLSLIRTGPVLVVVPNGSLLTQWRDRAEQFLEVEGGVGQIGDGILDVAGRGLVIGIVDSVASERLPQSVRDLFETIILDEGHRIATREGRNIFWRFPGRRIALSATWQRRDGLHRILELHVGPVLHSDDRVDLQLKGVFLYETGARVQDPSHALLAKGPAMTPRDRLRIGFNWVGVRTRLSKKLERNQMILEKVHAAAAKGRTILLLAPSIAQLTWFYKNANVEKKCLITGAVAMDTRMDLIQGSQLVVATDRLADTGLDYPALDCLILAFPQQPKQVIGRILRAYEGKQVPVVICFTDRSNPSAAKQALSFIKNVEKLGHKVFTVDKAAADTA